MPASDQQPRLHPPCPGHPINIFGIPISLPSNTSALTVLGGTLGTGFFAGTLGSTVGILRQYRDKPPLLLATKGAYNAVLVAFPFFGLFPTREYLINPLLKPHLLRPEVGTKQNPHTYNLVSSVLSGLVIGVGSGLFMKVPTPAAGRLGVILASLGGSAQFLINEADVLCRDWIQKQQGKEQAQRQATQPPGPIISSQISSDQLHGSPVHEVASTTTATTEQPAKPCWYDEWIPLKKLTDEQYVRRLESQRAEMHEELQQVNEDIRAITNDKDRLKA